jgi:hypothetical protein
VEQSCRDTAFEDFRRISSAMSEEPHVIQLLSNVG